LAQAIQAFDGRIGAESLGQATHELFSAVSPTERPMGSIEADEIIRDYIGELAGEEDPPLSEELQKTRLFLLIPTGSRKHPAWDAWPVADLSLPEAARKFGELRVAEDVFNATAPQSIDPVAPFDDPEFAKLW